VSIEALGYLLVDRRRSAECCRGGDYEAVGDLGIYFGVEEDVLEVDWSGEVDCDVDRRADEGVDYKA